MIRTIVTPENTELHLSLPVDYVGKQIEVLVYKSDEINQEKPLINNGASLRGTLQLSSDQYKNFNQYLSDSRNEW